MLLSFRFVTGILLLLGVCFTTVRAEELPLADGVPVFDPTGQGTDFDGYYIFSPTPLVVDDEFLMYYGGANSNAIQVGLATSPDGTEWTRVSDRPAYACGENTQSSCTTGGVWSSYRVVPVQVLREDGQYKLWYLGNNQNLNAISKLGYATSTDGIQWAAYSDNPIFPNISNTIQVVGLIRFDGQYLLYYRLSDSATEIFVATSADGITWSEHDSNATIPYGFDNVSLLDGRVIAQIDGVFAVSNDGVTFELSTIDTGLLSNSPLFGMLTHNDVLHVWYSQRVGSYTSIYHATSTLAAVLGELWDGGDEELGENTAPSIELVGSSMVYVERGSVWVEPGYEVSDAEDEVGDLSIDVDGDVDIDVEGAYVLVYTVSDTGGLSASTTRTVVVEPRKARAVAFLPGITGSRLYSGPDEARGGLHEKYWESAYWFHVDELGFDDDAESKRSDILTSGIVDRIRPFTGLFSYGEAYEGWLAELDAMVAAEDISDYAVLPYDWRLAIPNLAKGGVVNDDATLPEAAVNFMEEGDESYLIAQLRTLAAESPSGKVVLVAHSMGGLLAKYIMTTLASDDPLLDAIETVVFVGTPHLGTPKTLGELLHGSVPTAKITSREVTEDMPGPYQLVPSEAYFAAADTPAVVFEESVARDIHLDEYAGSVIDDADALLRFLQGNDGAWSEPAAFALARPNVLSSYLLQYAHGLHAVLDSWEAPEGMQVVNVVGWNRMTPSAIRYAMKCTPAQCGQDLYFLEYTYDLAAAGDGTVYGVAGEGVDVDATWYVHTDKINERDGTNRAHGTMLSMEDVFGVVHDVARGHAVVETETRTPERPSEVPEWASVVVHSPLDVHIFAGGKHTGVTGPGADDELGRPYEEEVTNSYYFEWGEVKYAGVILPQDGAVFTFDGTDEGWFTLDVTVPDGAGGSETYVWPDVAVLPESEGEMRVVPGQEPVLVYDYDGDGASDAELAPGETFEPWMMYAVTFEGLREAIYDAAMPSYAERHSLSLTNMAERYAYRSRTVYRSVSGLEQLAGYVRMQVGYGRVDVRKGETVAVLAEKLRALLRS